MKRTELYLNNAATSWPKPDCVARAMTEAVTAMPGSANRGGIQRFDVFEAVRALLAERMGVSDPDRIALGANATWGLNLALQGFPYRAGARVLTTNGEHNAVLRPLYALERRGLIQVSHLPVEADGRVCPERWERAVRELRPQLCVLTHASNVTGAVNDAPRLTALAHDAGAAVLLDASQSLGWIPVEAERWGLDLLAFTGHKYLLGPQGTGGLYVRPGLELSPVLYGGTGVYSDLPGMPEEMPLRLEAGTGNEPSCYGLLAALEWQSTHPLDTERERKKLERLCDGLAQAGCPLIRPEGERTPVLSFQIPGYTLADSYDLLSEGYDITLRSGLHCAPRIFRDLPFPEGSLRVSLSRFTTEEEIDQFLEAVRELLAARE